MKKLLKTKKEYLVLLFYIISIFLIIVCIFFVLKRYKKIKDLGLDILYKNNKDTITVSEGNLQPSDKNMYVLLEKAKLGVNTFTYTVYCQLDTKWDKDFTEENLRELARLGGTEDSLKGTSVFALKGSVEPTKALFTLTHEQNMAGGITSENTQTYYDFIKQKVYTQNTDLIAMNSDDWVEENVIADPMDFNNLFENFNLKLIQEDIENYYIKGFYTYNKEDKSLVSVFLREVLDTYNLTITEDIPIIIVVDKTTNLVQEIKFNINEIKDNIIVDSYKIVNTRMTITMSDINATQVNTPDLGIN